MTGFSTRAPRSHRRPLRSARAAGTCAGRHATVAEGHRRGDPDRPGGVALRAECARRDPRRRQADADRRLAELDRLRRPAGARRRPHRDGAVRREMERGRGPGQHRPAERHRLGALRRERRRRRRHHLRPGARGRQSHLRRGRARGRARPAPPARRRSSSTAAASAATTAGAAWRPAASAAAAEPTILSNYAHVQDPHAAYYRSSGSNDRAVNYDPAQQLLRWRRLLRRRSSLGGRRRWPRRRRRNRRRGGEQRQQLSLSLCYCGYAPYPPCN